MPGSGDMRVSDDQRERVAREIREHYAAGRLAYAARTERELDALRADLPPLPATVDEQRADVARRRSHLQRRLLQQSGGALAPFAICTVIWVLAGASGSFWPIWVGLFCLIPLLRNGWRLYGPAPELDRLEQDLARRERGEDRGRHGTHRTNRHAQRPHGPGRRRSF